MAFGSSAPTPPPNSYRTGCRAFAVLSLVLLGLFLNVAIKRIQVGNADAIVAGTRILNDQQAAWNTGNLAGFTATYRMHDGTTFFSEGRTYKGWEQINDRYRAMYAGRPMGELSYDDVSRDALSSNAVVLRGKWLLKSEGGTRTGLFTIVAQEFPAPEGWKIVHDHMTIGEMR